MAKRTPRLAGSTLSISAGTCPAGRPSARVAAQHAGAACRRLARAPGVLVPLALMAPEHQHAIAPPEVEVAVVLLRRPVERPEVEVRANAVAVAAAVDRSQPPHAPGLIAQPALAEDDGPGCAGGLEPSRSSTVRV